MNTNGILSHHTHVKLNRNALIDVADPGQLYRAFVLIYEDGVIVHSDYNDDWNPAIKRIAEPDRDGDCLVLIPAEFIEEALDEDEMAGVWEGLEADAEILRQAY